jgi:O-antigen ligase
MTAYQPSYDPAYDPAYASAAGYGYAPGGYASADFAGALPLDDHGAHADAADATTGRQFVVLPFFLGLVWGMGTGFSYLVPFVDAAYTQFAALVLSAVLMSFINPGWLAGWFNNKLGLLMLAHVVAVFLSGVVNGSHPLAIVRYFLLLPVMCIMIGAARSGERTLASLRAGLMVAGLVFVAYHLAFADLERIADPKYRLRLFLNPNGVGFIAAMTSIVALDFALGSRDRQDGPRRDLAQKTASGSMRLVLFACVLPCVLLCVATKSRTATAVCLGGLLVRLYFSIGFWRALGIGVVGGILGATIAAGVVSGFAEQVADTFQFNDRHRSLSGGTGRFRIWAILLEDVFLPNWLLGVGPAGTGAYASASTGVRLGNAHNGLIQYLCESGVLGVIPILLMLALAAKKAVQARRSPRLYVAIALFLAGVMESQAEIVFLSIGNPGSLLFMLSLAALCARRPDAPARARPVPQPFGGAAANAEAGYFQDYEAHGYPHASPNGNGNGIGNGARYGYGGAH